MDFDFRLGLIVMLAGVWVYLLSLIRWTTTHEPAKNTLLFLGGTHVLTLIYLVMALYSFYSAGLVALTDLKNAPPLVGIHVIEAILFSTWPLLLVVTVCCYAASRFGLFFGWIWLFIALVGGSILVIYFYIPDEMILSLVIAKHGGPIIVFIISAPLLSVGLTPFLSLLFADVEIETGREFYDSDDPIVVSINATGYLFRPDIQTIKCGTFKTVVNSRGVFRIPAEARLGDSLIQVDFRPQIIPFRLQRFKRVRIVKAS